jgi:hypothetical protein
MKPAPPVTSTEWVMRIGTEWDNFLALTV